MPKEKPCSQMDWTVENVSKAKEIINQLEFLGYKFDGIRGGRVSKDTTSLDIIFIKKTNNRLYNIATISIWTQYFSESNQTQHDVTYRFFRMKNDETERSDSIGFSTKIHGKVIIPSNEREEE